MKKYPKKPEAVYFFDTCLIDLLYPEVGKAGIKLLQREGVKVFSLRNKLVVVSSRLISDFMTSHAKFIQLKLNYFLKKFRL